MKITESFIEWEKKKNPKLWKRHIEIFMKRPDWIENHYMPIGEEYFYWFMMGREDFLNDLIKRIEQGKISLKIAELESSPKEDCANIKKVQNE